MKEKNKQVNKITAAGIGQIISGVLTVLILGIINLITRIVAAFTAAEGSYLLFIAGAVAGGLLLLRGITNCMLTSGYRRVAKAIGDNTSISFINLERRLYWKRSKLLRSLRRQIKRGLWPGAHIDNAGGMFFTEYNPVFVHTDSGNDILDEQLSSANAIIRDMVTATHHIQDAALKAKAGTLADIAGQIYSHVSKHPDKAGVVRRLTNYFLPTTVNLLQKYAQLQQQPVKTPSMTEAMEKIVQVMDTLEDVYRNRLDALYSEKAMDIDVEIEVLQNMAEM